MSQVLRRGVSRLETTTKLTLATLALASGVYTYLGVRGLLQGTGPSVFFGAIVYSTAVSVGIYAFWSYLIQFTPHVRTGGERRALVISMLLGSGMIVAMSSWLNAAALAGGAALEQHLAITTEEYQTKLNQAHNNALAAQSLLPDIQLVANRFQRLAEQENATGSLTGTSGSGTVVQLLTQMQGQLDELAEEVRASRTEADALYDQGGRYLNQMRRIVSSPGRIEQRSIAFGEEAVALAGLITALQETSIAPAVKRAADDLGAAFIAPEVDGVTPELAARQQAIVGRVEAAIQAQGRALAGAADGILSRDPVPPLRFTPLSTPEAVLKYADQFLPSWAGAISIDLMPAILVLILSGVYAAIRREEGEELDAHNVTVAEMNRALLLYEEMRADMEGTSAERPLIPDQKPAAATGEEQPPSDTPRRIVRRESASEKSERDSVTTLPTIKR